MDNLVELNAQDVAMELGMNRVEILSLRRALQTLKARVQELEKLIPTPPAAKTE